MEKSILLNSLFNNESKLDQDLFLEAWNYIKESALDSYEVIDCKFTCLINEQMFATYDGENLFIHASLSEESKYLAKKELEAQGFLRPLCEEVLYYPTSLRVEGSPYILSYVVCNQDHEVVKALVNMNLDVPVRAKAYRKDDRCYLIEVEVAGEVNPNLRVKKIGNTAVKCALVCLCIGWMNLAEAIEDKNTEDLNFRTDTEDQMIRYKKIIDKHIQSNQVPDKNKFYQNVELYQSQSDYERNQLKSVQKAASAGVREILNTDYRFEERLRTKLSQLEDQFFSGDEDPDSAAADTSTKAAFGTEESNLKIKNKVRVFQGRAQVEAQYSNYLKMKVEANAFATDKVKANLQTQTLHLKELGVQVYGQIRYLSSDQTVISEVRSGLGNNIDLSIYNKKTKQKDKPADENVIEMRYQLDF